ncbi:M20/M25/M40 family metallo-hydrolase [Parasphingorhabdus sp. DH2-15]|uniref:M20/M25/M40 family metallo-hydrolase n=1 Tax=Parasphingorhabdus sp. DH2-15 TaxID=3444112 RepID=UPI003F685B78
MSLLPFRPFIIFATLAGLALAPLQAQNTDQRIANISAQPKVSAALQSLEDMREKNIERLIAITEIPAPPFAEEARAADFAQRLRDIGLTDVTIDSTGNVIARRAGTGKETGALALVAHLDTVFPAGTDVTVRREGNQYFAPGIGDNSQGLVALLALAEVMELHGITTTRDILFVGSVGEEGLGDLRGVRALFAEGGPNISSMVAIDGGGASRLVTTAVGSHRYRVTFSGPGGHSYGAFGRAHPHQALAEAITRFTEAATPITQEGPKATFSVGRIGGGTSINSIPFTSWMEVDMRSANPDKLAALDVVFQNAMTEALEVENARRSANDPLTVEITSVGKRPAGSNAEDAALVTNAMSAIRQLGMQPQQVASSTDANIPLSLGIPAITLGRGGISRNAHAPNESWEDKDTHIALQVLLLTILAETND